MFFWIGECCGYFLKEDIIYSVEDRRFGMEIYLNRRMWELVRDEFSFVGVLVDLLFVCFFLVGLLFGLTLSRRRWRIFWIGVCVFWFVFFLDY